MNQRLRDYIEELFDETPKTYKVLELKEELIVNLNDKYEDLINRGTPEDQAFKIVTSSIGDINSIIVGLDEMSATNMQKIEEDRQKTALVVSTSVGLYILSVISLIFLTTVVNVDGSLAVIVMFLIAMVATVLLVYHFMSRPRYVRVDETVVEEFREWQSEKSKKKEILDSISSILWILITAIYLFINFTFNAWSYSWIIFIVGAAVQNIIRLIFQLKE